MLCVSPSAREHDYSSRRGGLCELHVLFYLVMNYYEVVEVFDLWTLYHDRFTHVHVLSFGAPDDEALFEPAGGACGVDYAACLDNVH